METGKTIDEKQESGKRENNIDTEDKKKNEDEEPQAAKEILGEMKETPREEEREGKRKKEKQYQNRTGQMQ